MWGRNRVKVKIMIKVKVKKRLHIEWREIGYPTNNNSTGRLLKSQKEFQLLLFFLTEKNRKRKILERKNGIGIAFMCGFGFEQTEPSRFAHNPSPTLARPGPLFLPPTNF